MTPQCGCIGWGEAYPYFVKFSRRIRSPLVVAPETHSPIGVRSQPDENFFTVIHQIYHSPLSVSFSGVANLNSCHL
jgi:hypothetical protein